MRTRHLTARLARDVKAIFDAYAVECGLSGSALAALLINREMHREWLRSRPPNRPTPDQTTLPTISAHLEPGLASKFRDYCDSTGRLYGLALAELLELELKERWLFRSLRLN